MVAWALYGVKGRWKKSNERMTRTAPVDAPLRDRTGWDEPSFATDGSTFVIQDELKKMALTTEYLTAYHSIGAPVRQVGAKGQRT